MSLTKNSPSKKERIKHSVLVQRIAAQCHLSEASVRTVLFGLRDVVISEVGQDRSVQLYGLGWFSLKHQKVHYKFKNRDHQEEQVRESVNPHFKCCTGFRGKVQIMNGVTPSFCHRSKDRQDDFLKRNNLDVDSE